MLLLLSDDPNQPLHLQIEGEDQFVEALIWLLDHKVWNCTRDDIYVLNPNCAVGFEDLVSALQADGHKWEKTDVLARPFRDDFAGGTGIRFIYVSSKETKSRIKASMTLAFGLTGIQFCRETTTF